MDNWSIAKGIFSLNYDKRQYETVGVEISQFENIDVKDIKKDPFSVIDNINTIDKKIPTDVPFPKSYKLNDKITVEITGDHVEISCICIDRAYAGKTSVTVCDNNKASVVLIDSDDVFVTMKNIANYLMK